MKLYIYTELGSEKLCPCYIIAITFLLLMGE